MLGQAASPVGIFAQCRPGRSGAVALFPGTGIVGNLGRNTFWTAGENNRGFSVLKDMRLYGERHHLQFRAEMYNLTNRVQFNLPALVNVVDTGVPGYQLNPNLGKITSQRNSPRNMLMMLRYTF